MTISEKGLALVKSFEGLRLAAYRDSVGIWTIGYGHTGSEVRAGMTVTVSQADALLLTDMQTAVHAVSIGVRVPLNQNQFDALCAFTYNVGIGNFLKSSLRTLLNEGNFAAAALEFGKWDKAGGKTLQGLINRRAAEAALFTSAT